VAEGRVIVVGDYEAGAFAHDELADSLAAGDGIRDMVVAPIIGDNGPLGAIEVFSRTPNRFDSIDAAVLGGLAEQAAIAITNARLIDELERSQTALAQRVERERSLRDITARIAALRDPDEVLERVVEEAKRLLGTDGAHLTRLAEDGNVPDPGGRRRRGRRDDPAELLAMRFPLGGGINGLAAQGRTPIWTFDYMVDPRIPHELSDTIAATQLRLRGMAAAPLRAPGGEVIGTLAVSSAEPRLFEADDLDLLQGMADQAAIALTNSNLLARLTREEARFRGLVQTTPDVLWRADADGIFTFMADIGETLFGWPIEEIIGKHFAFLTDPCIDAHRRGALGPRRRQPGPRGARAGDPRPARRLDVPGGGDDHRRRGGRAVRRRAGHGPRRQRAPAPGERAASLGGALRYLVQNAPDIVWSINDEAKLTFLSGRHGAAHRLPAGRAARQALRGDRPRVVADVTEIDWSAALQAPSQELRGRVNLLHRDGSPIPAEFIAVASMGPDGRFAGANGSVRDMRDHDRLERELQRSEERYRFLVEQSPDIVFATDAEGRFTFLSEAIGRMTDYRPTSSSASTSRSSSTRRPCRRPPSAGRRRSPGPGPRSRPTSSWSARTAGARRSTSGRPAS
jgi:GAF domain-containing protein